MSCPKCGRQIDDDAVICPGCDFIIDSSFLGDDITDAKDSISAREPSLVVQNPLLSSAGYGQDDLILGDGAGEFEAFESQNTGLAREVTHARIFVGGAASELLRPDAIPGLKKGVDPSALKLTPFEVHVLSLVNAYRPVGRIRKKSGMSDAEVHTSLAMLHDKGVIELAGHVSEARKDRARKRRKERRRAERARRNSPLADSHELPDDAGAANDAPVAAAPADGADDEHGPSREEDANDQLADSALDRAVNNIDAQLSLEPSGRSDAALANAIGNPARGEIPSVVERTMISLPPNAPEPEPNQGANADAADPFIPAPTGDVDLDALAADAAAGAAPPGDVDDAQLDAPQMSEQELLLSMAEGAVSEVALESESQGGEFDLDALAEGAARHTPPARPSPAASPASEDESAPLLSGEGEFGFDAEDNEPDEDIFDDSAADAPILPATADPARDDGDAAGHDRSGPLPADERVLEALADEFDAFDRNDLEPTGASQAGVSIDVGSIDIASVDVESVDFASEVEDAGAGASLGPPPLPSSESIPMGFSLEEDADLADALLDSEEGPAFDDEDASSVIRPAAKVAPAMTSSRAIAASSRSPTVDGEPGLPGASASSASASAIGGGRPTAGTPLPGQGLPPPLPGASLPGSTAPPLPGSTAPPLPGTGGLHIESAEGGAEGISLEGFSLEDSSEEQQPAASRLPPTRPPASNVGAPAAAAAPPPARPTAPVQAVSFEMKRKARLIFEQAQKDMIEGRPSSALMNAKLACIYDPSEPEFPQSLDAWQNQSMSNMARPKELLLFEEAKDAELDGEYEDAVSLLRQALDINPRAAPIYNRLGVILATRLKQFAPASQALLQACELDPGNLAYKNNLGKILVMEEKEVDSKRKKKGLADRLLGGKEDANVRVRTIRPKQF